MKRALLRNVSLCTRKFLISSPSPSPLLRPKPIIPPFSVLSSRFCSSSSDKDSPSLTLTPPGTITLAEEEEDVSNQVAPETITLAEEEETQKQNASEVEDASDQAAPETITLTVEETEEHNASEVEDVSNQAAPETITLAEEEETQKHDAFEVEDVSNQAAPETITLAEEEETQKHDAFEVEDVSNREYIKLVNQYLEEQELSSDEYDEYEMKAKSEKWLLKGSPRPERKTGTEDFETDMLDVETDSDIDDLYDTKSIVMGRLKDTYLNMDDTKWDDLIKEHTGQGYSEVMQQCEQILEDMTDSNKLLPVELKNKVEVKFEELGEKCERGELEPNEAYELFKKFEDEVVNEYNKTREVGGPPQSDETVDMDIDEPPGEGPILRWQTRAVFGPGKSAWHPKNRKVKLSVTVKELGLSKHQYRRLRALVGNRYDPRRDELTINSDRFEHREENRKDCLRKLYSLIEEAAKADEMVEDARASYVKERLSANPAFMERLNAKIMRLQGQTQVPA